ncbi:MAG: hypothetical protein AAFP03_16410, partial [Cyanobacteria bacterium J06598_3]
TASWAAAESVWAEEVDVRSDEKEVRVPALGEKDAKGPISLAMLKIALAVAAIAVAYQIPVIDKLRL